MRIEHLGQAPVQNEKNIKRTRAVDFGKAIKEAVSKVNRAQRQANSSIIDLLHGKADIPETMIALQKADISMRLLLTIRNKVIEAYREIMRMQF
ncbi:MAG: flagellar hook-basal body complex protein FliE [Deltaproteobacteria bacterium]|nr:flagellar hook-basal body complex protein FliE [Deltaproteobacteria bacterium]MBW1919656.1 flagellar hook-basal body complex protein FliE [Deltaproteobacteria bacterium]MBW1934024.1 flagellar hook-basal body complex protein FliE [Deltaproteobacteria bacterium]MBW1976403.1 flagellar hook-basal body complex protein FliE [Deltaproteobacteria bacterium]MBW2043319.1 flagellar hook-basal body complex protein FliE [Deltaproteobacteria bacterium]